MHGLPRWYEDEKNKTICADLGRTVDTERVDALRNFVTTRQAIAVTRPGNAIVLLTFEGLTIARFDWSPLRTASWKGPETAMTSHCDDDGKKH